MNHPTPEDLASLLYRELSRDQEREIRAHLDQCDSCKALIKDYQAVQLKLDSFTVSTSRRSRSGALPGVVKWGLAAGVVFGLGFLAAQSFRPPSLDEAALEARLLPKLRRELLAISTTPATSPALSTAEIPKEIADFLAEVRLERDRDRNALSSAFDQLIRRQDEHFYRFRQDLETVALAASDQIRKTRVDFGQLVAHVSTDQSSPSPGQDHPSQVQP